LVWDETAPLNLTSPLCNGYSDMSARDNSFSLPVSISYPLLW